jgi:hypothetical protein
VWLLASVVALAGCGGVQTLSFPAPAPTTPTTAVVVPTLPKNLSSLTETSVPGTTTTVPIAMGPGTANLTGTVQGPSGPVAGATVEADRLVGDGGATAETTTAADGTWSIRSVLGGRYRLRAWQSPSLALTTPQIFFLGNGQTQAMTLQLISFTGPQIQASMAPGNPVAGQVDNLLVQVTNPIVSTDGVVAPMPDVGASVTLVDGPEWQVLNGNPLATDAAGNILFQVTCLVAGVVPLSAQVANSPAVPLQVPSCSAPAPPTTTTTTTTPPPSTLPCPTGPTVAPPTGPTTTSTTLFPGTC